MFLGQGSGPGLGGTSAHPGHSSLFGKCVCDGCFGSILSRCATKFAAHIGVSRVTLSRVLNQKGGVTAEMSIKISEAFGQDSPDIWFNLQNDYDLWQAAHARPGRKRAEPLKPAA
ncbi:MAG: HigA family addiction module antitoxin [Terracidiphilus sp.]